MKLHNVMEDIVGTMVEEIFAEEELSGAEGFCTSDQCKLDVTCFVLNRVTPKYIVSGRGLTHFDIDYLDKLQREADLASRIYAAIEVVSNNQRPQPGRPQDSESESGPCFNPPTFTGRVFNSLTFEPVSDVEVVLYRDGELVTMISSNWQNPVRIVPNTPGSYSFWPRPIAAEEIDQRETLEFEIAIDSADYEPIKHYFQLSLQAQNGTLGYFTVDQNVQVKDLYLVPR